MSLHRSRPARTRRGRATAPVLRAAALGPVAALVLSLLAPVPASAALDCGLAGAGTEGEPWQVATAADLALVGQGDCGVSGIYLQTTDITLTGDWTPIAFFTGVFDGDGNTITGLTVDLPTSSRVGMFGNSSGTIRDVHLVDVSIAGQGQVGGLAGTNSGTITESSVAGTVTGRDAVGGLAGTNSGTIDRSSSDATVTSVTSGLSQFGGLVGLNSGTIEYSFASGNVTATGPNSGYVGGLVGHLQTSGLISDSYALGNVSSEGAGPSGGGGGRIGGLVGWGEDGTISHSFSTGEVTDLRNPPGEPGGLVGDNDPSGTAPNDKPGAAVSESVWDIDTSGVAEPGPGDGLATSAMTDIGTYLERNWAIEATCDGGGFDPPTAVWGICPTINDGYPYLRWSVTASPSSSSSTDATAAPSTPVRVAGALPSLAAGDATWNRGGTLTSLTATSSAARSVTYGDAESGVRVTVTGARGTSIATGVVAEVDGELVCEICADLAASSVIEVWMFSEPRLVAAHRVDDLPCQRFVVPLGAPLDGGGTVATGTHTLQLAIPTAAGMEAVDIGITVGGPVPTTVPAGEGPTPTPAAWPVALLLGVAVTLGLAGATRREALLSRRR